MREKKALIWQKKYLTKLLYHVATSPQSTTTKCLSMDEPPTGQKINKFRVGALVVIGMLRLQTMADRWRDKVERRKLSNCSSSSNFSTSQTSGKDDITSNGSSC